MQNLVFITIALIAFDGASGIVGGQDGKIEDHNYYVAILYDLDYSCGGVLVAPSVVVTSGSCTARYKGYEKYLTVLAGSDRINEGEWRNTKTIYLHPLYKIGSNDYDVGILILEEPFNLSQKIGLIQLVSKTVSILDGTASVVMGFGTTKESESECSSLLQIVTLVKIAWDRCKYFYAGITLTERMACWGTYGEGKGFCQRDIGGPLVVNNDGQPMLAGIASWSQGCGRYGKPGVFANITNSEINDFIAPFI